MRWVEGPAMDRIRSPLLAAFMSILPLLAAVRAESPGGDANKKSVDAGGSPLPTGAIARLGTTCFRHNYGVTALVFSPDGTKIASRDHSYGAHLWDAATGKEVQVLEGQFSCVAFSPDRKHLAAGFNNIRVWDLTSGTEQRALQGHPGMVMSLAYSPDGKRLASGGTDNCVRLWDVGTSNELRLLQGHAGPVNAVAFSPDGKMIASAGGDPAIRLWEAATGKEIRRLAGHENMIYALAFAPTGKTLASAGEDGTIRLWDVAAGKELVHLPKQEAGVHAIAFSPDGKSLVGSGDRMVRLWEVATGKEIRHWEGHVFDVNAVAFSPDGRAVATGAEHDSVIRFWDPATGAELHRDIGHHAPVWTLSFSRDGKTLLSRAGDKTVCRWDLATGTVQSSFGGPRSVRGPVAVSPDHKLLACAGRLNDFKIRLFDQATAREVRLLGGYDHGVDAVAFSRDGTLLASGGRDPIASIWDVATGRELHRLIGHEGEGVYGLAFSANNRMLATAAARSDEIIVWDVATGKKIRQIAGGGELPTLCFSPDGTVLATASSGGPVHVFDPSTGRELRPLQGLHNGARQLVFSPDGLYLAAGGGENDPGHAVHVWEVATGQEVLTLDGHRGQVCSIAFSADGKTLATGGMDSTILIWDVPGAVNQGGRAANNLSPHDVEECWNDLGAEDGVRAFRALWKLAVAAGTVAPYLKDRLAPEPAVSSERLAALVRNLDSDEFGEREKAMQELIRLGDLAEPILRQTLAGEPSLEVRRRAEQLLANIDPGKSRKRLRELRATAVLEYIGTSEAVAVLQTLAAGAPESILTRQAVGALQRLAARADKR
jgi:WD40 repeat protein